MRGARIARAAHKNDTETDRFVRVGFCTVNVRRNLSMHLSALLKYAASSDIKVIAVQEAGVTMEGRHSIRSAAMSLGYFTWFNYALSKIVKTGVGSDVN